MLSKKPRQAKKKASVISISPEEVTHLEAQAASHAHSETTWLKMTSLEEEDDVWNKVEEHLLSKSQQQDRLLTRWKHFAK